MMVQLRDGVLLVQGVVLDVEQLRNFETKAPDGIRLTVKTAEGFALVKVTKDDERVFTLPENQRVVAWVRPMPWSRTEQDGRSGQAQLSLRWVRPFDGNDLDALVGAVAAPAGK